METGLAGLPILAVQIEPMASITETVLPLRLQSPFRLGATLPEVNAIVLVMFALKTRLPFQAPLGPCGLLDQPDWTPSVRQFPASWAEVSANENSPLKTKLKQSLSLYSVLDVDVYQRTLQ